jgi:hypothetical protein
LLSPSITLHYGIDGTAETGTVTLTGTVFVEVGVDVVGLLFVTTMMHTKWGVPAMSTVWPPALAALVEPSGQLATK